MSLSKHRLIGSLSRPDENVIDLGVDREAEDVLDILSDVIGHERSTRDSLHDGLGLGGIVLVHDLDKFRFNQSWADAGHPDVLALRDVSDLERVRKSEIDVVN